MCNCGERCENAADNFNEEEVMKIANVAVGMFISQCGEMAEQNWCTSQVEMLERLFGAVLHGCKYDEWEREDG